MELENFYARLDHPTKDQVFREMDEWCNSLERVQTLVQHPKYPLMMQWHPESAHFFSGIARRSLAHAKTLFGSIPTTVKSFIFEEIFNGMEGSFAKLCFFHPLAGSLSSTYLENYINKSFEHYKIVVWSKRVQQISWRQWPTLTKSSMHFQELIRAREDGFDANALLQFARDYTYDVFGYVVSKVSSILASGLKEGQDVLSWNGIMGLLKTQDSILHEFLNKVYEKHSVELTQEECLRRIHIALKDQLPKTHWAYSLIKPSRTNLFSCPEDCLVMIAERGIFGDLVRLSSTCKALHKTLEFKVRDLKTFSQKVPRARIYQIMPQLERSVPYLRATLHAKRVFTSNQLLTLIRASIPHARAVLESDQVKTLKNRKEFLLSLAEEGYGALEAKHTWYAFSGYELLQIAQKDIQCAQAVLHFPKARKRLSQGHIIGIICASEAHAKAFAAEYLPQLKIDLLQALVKRQREFAFSFIKDVLARVYRRETITNFYLFRSAILRQAQQGSVARICLSWIETLSSQHKKNWIKWVAARVRMGRI